MSSSRTDRPNSMLRLQSKAISSRIASRIPVKVESSSDQNTITNFMKQMDGQQAAALNRSIRQGERLHVLKIIFKQPVLKNRAIPVSAMQQMMLSKVEAGISKLSVCEKEKVSKILTRIEEGEPVHEDLVSMLQQKIVIKLISNHGHKDFFGLTGIEVLSSEQTPLPITIDPGLETLINGVYITIDEKNMWQHRGPMSINILVAGDPHFIRFWNYNKNRLELSKGVKLVEIIFEGSSTFELNKGIGNTLDDYSQTFPLRNQKLKTERNETPQQPFYQSMQSIHSKRSDEVKEVNSSKNSAKYSRPKISFNPFDEDVKKQNFFMEIKPTSNQNKLKYSPQLKFIRGKQSTEEDQQSPIVNIKRGVAHIAAGSSTNRQKRITIPECPQGSRLQMRIIRNWGDANYVGLTGIEIFDCNGLQVTPFKVTGFFRQGSRLFDGSYMTSDENSMCLEKLTKNMVINMEFAESKIAMIRFWNYNKARTNSVKGVRNLELLLDGDVIFSGEIKQSFGTCSGENAEYIMFTQNEEILNTLESNDWMNQLRESQLQQERHILENTIKLSRPDTATFQQKSTGTTTHKFVAPQHHRVESIQEKQRERILVLKSHSQHQIKMCPSIKVKQLKITVIKNWGDRYMVGLDKIFIQDQYSQNIAVKQYNMKCSKYDGLFKCDQRWTCMKGGVEIIFQFTEPKLVSKIILYNFNKPEELDKGIQLIVIHGDGQLLCQQQGVYIRRGLGINEEAPQSISLPCTQSIKTILSNYQFEEWIHHGQDYETMQLPQGMKLTMNLVSTWGDLHYIGLNGIEIFDSDGAILNSQIIARPHSVKELPQMELDIRTPDKLLNGQNETLDRKSMWLAPFANTFIEQLISNMSDCEPERQMNKLFFLFDAPVQISAINVYNYAEDPLRGVREIEVLIDDLIVYRGYLNLSTLLQTKNSTLQGNNKTTILFTRDEHIIELVRTVNIRESILGQQTVFINEQKKMTKNTIKNTLVRQHSQNTIKSLNRPNTTQVH